jgi:F0F1-type ATP synthase membrane subunit b/b'
MLTRLQENIKNRNQAAQGQAAMMGGTDEALAATKQQNNEALADATSQIVANADARKDQIEQQYRERKDRLDDQMANLQMQQATEVGKAVQGVADAGANIASAF